jgi:hypothetical protein
VNIFQVHLDYRKFGLGYGLPMLHIEMGPGVSYKLEELLDRLIKAGLRKDGWVVIMGDPSREQGTGVLIDALKTARVKIEVEDDGKGSCPGWILKTDRYIVDWNEISTFNYGALRSRQDMLVYRGSNIGYFLEKTVKEQALRVIVTKDPKAIWDKVKDLEVRVYAN